MILDVGCGTGLITREFARLGYQVTGIDPSSAMIEAARTKQWGDDVNWIVGPVSRIEALRADLVIMSGHVAQFFLDDQSWHEALEALHATLRPGGHLAFESRNPDAREWQLRSPRRSATDLVAGRIEFWSEATEVRHDIVEYTDHYLFESTGEELTSHVRLRFRNRQEFERTLRSAGFRVEQVFGDWDKHPAESTSPELIFVVSR